MVLKEILQHLLFWAVFILLWSAHDLVYFDNFFILIRGNLFTLFPLVPLVYLNLYWLMPKFLLKKKHAPYILIMGLCLLITTFVASANSYYYYSEIRNHQDTANFFYSSEGKIAILTEMLVVVGVSMILYLLREWYQKERYAREMEQKRLETELHLLKSQINPHFLFNSLNSIYVMLGKNTKAGRKMLLQFSEILSHQLYEASKEKVPLQKEIENLKNYIRIEKIRHDDLANVELRCSEDINGEHIAPMLLLPIVENAFKHGQSSEGYWIDVRLDMNEENELLFSVKNSYTEKEESDHQGIGLSNVKRRLELIYPGRHQLSIEKLNSIFQVNLKLKLNEHAVHYSG